MKLTAQLRDTIGASHLDNDDVLNACISLILEDEGISPEALAYIVKEFPKVMQRRRRSRTG